MKNSRQYSDSKFTFERHNFAKCAEEFETLFEHLLCR